MFALDAEVHDDVESRVTKLQGTFRVMEELYDAYLLAVVDVKSEEAVKLGEWFEKELSGYYENVKSATSWLKEAAKPSSPKVNDAGSGKGTDNVSLARLFDLPKVEIETFRGEPMEYHSFMRTFQVNVESVCTDPDARLARLIACTSGAARDAIRGTQIIGVLEGYERAKEILHEQFGSNHLIVQEVVKGLRFEKVHQTVEQMREFSFRLINARDILRKMNALGEVNAQSTILELANALPNFARNKWFKRQMDSKREKQRYLNFEDFVVFVEETASDMADPVCGMAARNSSKGGKQQKGDRKQESSFASSDSASASKKESVRKGPRHRAPTCARCNEAHMLSRCGQFKGMSVPERIAFVGEKHLCSNCLRADHPTSECLSDNRCFVCKEKHSVFLHVDRNVSNAAAKSINDAIFMPIVEVLVNDTKLVRAALDTCSTASFCTRELADELGLQGVPFSYTLSTLHGGSSQSSQLVKLSISKGSERGGHFGGQAG
jgi:hypothetical protein